MATTKWDCPVCTYLNWSSSLKCTLCGCNKPVLTVPPKSTIAKMKQGTQASLAIKPSSSPPVPIKPELPSSSYWSCTDCTYTNWSNSSLCTMCSSPKNKLTTPTKPPRHVTRSESIFDCVGGASEATPPDRPKRQNRRVSPPRLKKKWTCRTCTYENWPRSVKCVMCGNVSEDNDELSCATDTVVPPSTTDTVVPSSTTDTVIPSSTTGRVPSFSTWRDDVRQIRNKFNLMDWLFLDACRGVLSNDMSLVRGYIKQGGDRGRHLTEDEVFVLNEPSKYTVGSTLVHLAVRFHRSDMLSYLLTPAPVEARKRLPSHVNVDLATNIRQLVHSSICTHDEWLCQYINQLTTFILPHEITNLNPSVMKKLLEEIIDLDVQKELQEEALIINWSNEISETLHSRLYPLWNRTAGDCLLDSALQATWGVVDREGTLRQALSDSLVNGSFKFYDRWREAELMHAHAQEFNIEEDQLKSDWSIVLSSAVKQGRPLEQMHIFVLAHVLRRPVIVYGVKVVKNYKGEQLGLANFEGIYLPLLWDTSFCWRVPIALGYTRGHFSALVGIRSSSSDNVVYLPLVDSELRPLPVHFVSEQLDSYHDDLVKEYCDCHVTSSGILTAQQIISSNHQPSQLTVLIEEWLDRFLKLNKTNDITL